ncbi:E3 ubiquitin ligase PARAQUAT TOLERANCE 3 isoform X2 [Hevea brasiliensis]|uniref:E3 ubiquitin ligase PARAQUAT TOLERANCE 3 isoform X2 n=1 Tax=Hevea brasiliensis TaxID=3981 RepID=UPI0025F49163|nr:E3 ubiquitin ligase PARAQUAT TOLERANCE 3 isoform X2 [Hevea brasiliensis]
MAIRFRFRSSVNYDSVVIEGQPSISVRDLKAKIVRSKNLNICQDFDLVFSDAETGQEYYDENIQLPSGSSVIIKRVPAGSMRADKGHVESFENVGIKDTNVFRTSAQANVEVDNFDDFGAELCPIPEATISGSDFDVDKQFLCTNDETPRFFEIPRVGCQKLDASELIESIPTRPSNIGDSEDASQIKSKPSVDALTKPKKVVTANPQSMQNVDLPAELKCYLCGTFFKEAVMIPCCQHSFCEKCIQLVLVEKRSCPKCLSTKYTVKDLLPNVSLRQAIERFLESQILIKSSDNAFGYAPDGESGIQVKELSCAVSVHQREAVLPHSPCATRRGSNQIMGKSVSGKSSLCHKLKQLDAEKHGSRHPVDLERGAEDLVSEFQGENQPLHEEAESTIKKKRGSCVNTADRSFMETGRHRKGDRTCYMCGSPDHFIRDCPAASSPHPMLQTGNAMFPGAMTGYLSPYWNGPFPQIRPLLSPYGNPFATIVPPTTFPVPSYMPSMFGGMAPYGGFTKRVGRLACPVGPNAEWHVDRSDCWELQGDEKRRKVSHNNLGRGQSFDDDEEDDRFNKRRKEPERSHDLRSYQDREDGASVSKDSFTERPNWKHRHYANFDDELERSSSEVEDMPSSSNRHGEERRKCRHRNSKKHDGGMVHISADSSHSRSHGQRQHQSSKTKDVKRKRVGSEGKRDKQKHHSQSESGLQQSLSSDHKAQWKERDSSHGSRHSRHNSRSMNNELSRERWQMVSGSDEDGDEDDHYYKRKRHH